MYFVVDKAAAGGYMVSNRPGVIALKNETCCDDIFSFRFDNMIYVAVQGYVYDVDDTTNTPLDGSLVSLYLSQLGTDTDLDVNERKKTTEVTETTVEDVLITGDTTRQQKMYFFNLSTGRDYKLSASKEGFFSGKGLFTDFVGVTTRGISESDTLRADLYLKRMQVGVAYKLKNIYYDFDKANLRTESEFTLDSLLIILEEHPTIKIEIGSHTDSRGSDEYNIKLSQKRAESVVKFLAKKRIPIERMVAKGYGESTPVAPNKKPDGTDNPEGRQLNRRTEFKILGKVDGEVIYDRSEIDQFNEGQGTDQPAPEAEPTDEPETEDNPDSVPEPQAEPKPEEKPEEKKPENFNN
jgi:outer membrane protein OmpA-like peptidoglycan-associated protein